jgi:hypothetical protein
MKYTRSFMNTLLARSIALTFLMGSCAVYADSTINLPLNGNGQIAPNSEIALDLNPLTNDVPYMITCEVESSSPTNLDMSVTQHLAPNGGFGVAKVNDKPMMRNVGALQNGQNTLSFLASVGTKGNAANQLILKNLDNRFASNVKSCQARPASNVTDMANRVHGGYFYVTNHLPYYVDITVGSYFPDAFCIPPYMKQYVSVSTAYQDIDIVGTHY